MRRQQAACLPTRAPWYGRPRRHATLRSRFVPRSCQQPDSAAAESITNTRHKDVKEFQGGEHKS